MTLGSEDYDELMEHGLSRDGDIDSVERGGGSGGLITGRLAFIALSLFGMLGLFYRESNFALADEGGGGGGSEGGGSSSGTHYKRMIWFDRGGFVDAGAEQPVQGWNSDSADYFLDRMEAIMGGEIRGSDGTGRPHIDKWRSAANEALANARRRSSSGRARIVGVGWAYLKLVPPPGYGFGHGYTYNELLTRAGNSTELPSADGWGDVVDGTGHSDARPGETWRDYIWRIGRVDNPGDDYSVVVVAVADSEPPQEISVPVTKSWLADAGYLSNRPKSVKLQLICDADGTKYEITLTAADGWKGTFEHVKPGKAYRLHEVPVPGYESTSKRKSGELKDGFTVSNTLQLTKRIVCKVWDNTSPNSGRPIDDSSVRPARIMVYLDGSDGSHREAELNVGNGWTHTWDGLIETLSTGEKVVYTVSEELLENYSCTVTTGSETYTLTNRIVSGFGKLTKEPSHPTWVHDAEPI